ncbi:MAG: ATP-binding cassette domain-containing protein [Clostridia bacterium]|nr:ATP-binding cassette domain-containing protein [Deltaproteobacteria bacterium]
MDIAVERLVKHYRVHSRSAGARAALRSLFFRKYDTVRAVDDISFAIASGERVGFLGPNGAGKTTTLKVLAGLLAPTSGAVRVGVFTPNQRHDEFLRNIMLVTGQKNQLLWDLPPADTFELNRAVYNVSPADFASRVGELVELLDIGAVIRKPTRQLSLGERMKCEIAAALIHRPRLLFLDEPTIGLDVTMQALVRRFIRTYSESYGATVLLTSHDMDDVAAICDRVVIINHGTLSYDGDLGELVKQTRPEKRVTFTLSQSSSADVLVHFGRVIAASDRVITLQVEQARLKDLIERAFLVLPVSDLTVENAPLEEVLADVFARGRAA